MARAFLKIYFDFDERTEELTEAEKGRLLLAMLRYARTGEKPNLTGNERFCFSSFKADIDRDCEAYTAKVTNGIKGGRPAKEKPNVTENNLKKPNVTENNLNVKNKKKNKKEDIKENTISDEIVEKKRPDFSFAPPTLEEIQDYCKERQSRVDPKAFFDYYTAGNWLDGRSQPVKNWKQKLITWEKHEPAARAETKPKRKSWAELGAELDAQRERERAYDGI